MSRKPLPTLGPLNEAVEAQNAPVTGPKKSARRTSLAVSPAVADRVRDAAHEDRETVREVVERAILAEVVRMEAQHGDGYTFPPRPRRK